MTGAGGKQWTPRVKQKINKTRNGELFVFFLVLGIIL